MKKIYQQQLKNDQQREIFKNLQIERSQERSKGIQKIKEHEEKYNYITYRSTLDFENLDTSIEINAFCDPPFIYPYCPMLPLDGRFIKLKIGNRELEINQIKGNFPIPKSAIFLFNNSVIMGGGYLKCVYQKAHCEFSVNTLELRQKLSLPQPRARNCGCPIDREHYAVLSGIDGYYSDVFPNFLFDENKQTWALIPSLRHQRFGAASVSLSKRIYILGGTWIQSKPRSSIERWDWTQNSDEWQFVFEMSPFSYFFQRQLPLLLGITKHQFLILGGIKNSMSGNIIRVDVEKQEVREYQDITNTLQFWYGKMAVFGEDSCIYLEGTEPSMLAEGKFMGLELHERGGIRLGTANFYPIETVKKQ